jgi:hypothetical protein
MKNIRSINLQVIGGSVRYERAYGYRYFLSSSMSFKMGMSRPEIQELRLNKVYLT